MAFYGIEVVQLVEAGFIKPGASSNPGKTKSDMLAVVLADGRIRTADGQVFNALSGWRPCEGHQGQPRLGLLAYRAG
ncbi:hypothetical protein [Streptacidiphilus albus]|uniref:hypothetical protein n=1 Tax=Streptacidiphilus albus TaxID=105425 RepID=UPI00128D1776|nr:hypothetical protein [Streptacidiphilus albus]